MHVSDALKIKKNGTKKVPFFVTPGGETLEPTTLSLRRSEMGLPNQLSYGILLRPHRIRPMTNS